MIDMIELNEKTLRHFSGVSLVTPGNGGVVHLPPRVDEAAFLDARPAFDAVRVERAVREILEAIGEDADREGLRETPARVARALREMLSGLHEDAGRHLERSFEHAGEGVVALRDVEFSSVCEHHLLPFSGRAHLAYLPGAGRVIGLSKLARTVEAFARRPQLQERLGEQIAEALVARGGARGATVMLEAEHLCLRLRGARSPNASMRTVAHRGVFADDAVRRREAMELLKG